MDVTADRTRPFFAAALWILLGLTACVGPGESPETQIRSLISNVAQAAEERDLSVIQEAISDEYQDQRGHNRQTVLRIVQGIFLRNRQIHLLSVVRDLQVDGSNAAALVLVAMAGQPIESARALVNIRADLIRFDVGFVLEGDEWRVHSVEWRRADVSDFL